MIKKWIDKQSGIIWIILAAILWSLQGVLGKLNTWNSLYLSGFRAIFAGITIGSYRRSFYPSKNKINWLAAMAVAMTGILFLSANNLTTAANAVVLQYTMPVFVILLRWFQTRKKPGKMDVICCIVMLVGVSLCFVNGLTGGHLKGDVLAILSAGTYALVYLSAGTKGCDVLSYSYQGNLISILLILLPLFDKSFSFSVINVLTAAAMGIFVGAGYICFAKGFSKNINSTQAAIVSYMEPILNPVWVMLFVGEKVEGIALIGIVIVLSMAVIYSIYLKKEKT